MILTKVKINEYMTLHIPKIKCIDNKTCGNWALYALQVSSYRVIVEILRTLKDVFFYVMAFTVFAIYLVVKNYHVLF